MVDELRWSSWADLADPSARRAAPTTGGLYRVRMTGEPTLAYVGQTGNLRRRLGDLSALYRDEIPYNDPHTAAPCLWVLRVHHGASFQFSVAEFDGSAVDRKARECVEISRHRCEMGASPLANFGRMPEGWVKSTGNNSSLARRGALRRGHPAPTAHRTADFPCIFDPSGDPVSAQWAGLIWSPWLPLDAAPAGTGLYRVRGTGASALAYVGQGAISQRLRAHAAKGRQSDHPQAAMFAPPVEVSWVIRADLGSQQLLEAEGDLIASHVAACGNAPTAQFLG